MKEEKWGLAQPVLYMDEQYGEIYLKAFGTYTLESTTGANVEEMLSSNPSIEEHARSLVVQNVTVEINRNQHKNYMMFITGLNKEAIMNGCNESLANVGLKITKLSLQSITPTEESEIKINEISKQRLSNNNPTTAVPSTQPTTPTPAPKKNKVSPLITGIIVVLCLAFFAGKKFMNTDKVEAPKESNKTETLEIKDSKFGFSNVPFKDSEKGNIKVNIMGTYSYEITDQELFERKYGKYEDYEKYKEGIEETIRAHIYSEYSNYIKEIDSFTTLNRELLSSDFKTKLKEDKPEEYITLTSIKTISVQLEDETTPSPSPTEKTTTKEIKADIYLLSKEEGGRHTPCFINIEWDFDFDGTVIKGTVLSIDDDEMMMPGQNYTVKIKLEGEAPSKKEFIIKENDKQVGRGTIKGE